MYSVCMATFIEQNFELLPTRSLGSYWSQTVTKLIFSEFPSDLVGQNPNWLPQLTITAGGIAKYCWCVAVSSPSVKKNR